MAPPDDNYPNAVDLSRILWPVEDVGTTLATTASVAARLLEVHWHRIDAVAINLSTMFIHYNARLALGQEGQDVGVTIPGAMNAIKAYGACTEAAWPFDPAKINVKPPPAAYAEAKKYAAVLEAHPSDPIQALAMDYPIAICPRVPERCVTEAGNTGILPDLTTEERATLQHCSGYAFTVMGYDKTARTFTLRNAWGTAWGKDGQCTISFDTMTVLCPASQNRWMITAPRPEANEVSAMAAAAPVTQPPAPAVAAPPESMADMAARLRAEIRGDLQRDLTDASLRIKDLLGRTPPPAPPQVQNACSACSGRGGCWACSGRGCASCGGTGKCPKCGGSGRG